MAVERIPCKYCGAMILPSTAAATDGRCMPCHKQERGMGNYVLRVVKPDDFLVVDKNKILTIKQIASLTHAGFDQARRMFETWPRGGEIILRLDSPLEMKRLMKALHQYGYAVTLLEGDPK